MPTCVLCGLRLAEKTLNCHSHFGLQNVEHVARLGWNSVSLWEVSLKSSDRVLFTDGTLSNLKEGNTEGFLCQTMEEMIKGEQPQHWLDMQMEWDTLSR